MKKFLAFIGIFAIILLFSFFADRAEDKKWAEFQSTGDPSYVGVGFAHGFSYGWNVGSEETLDSVFCELDAALTYVYDRTDIIRGYIYDHSYTKKDVESALNDIEEMYDYLESLYFDLYNHDIYVESDYYHD